MVTVPKSWGPRIPASANVTSVVTPCRPQFITKAHFNERWNPRSDDASGDISVSFTGMLAAEA
jgi:hypothetical protein